MVDLTLAICKHPEHSWCLCWIFDVPGASHLIEVYDPFNPEPPKDTGLALALHEGELIRGVETQADLCQLLGKALVVRSYNDSMKGLVLISQVWEHKAVVAVQTVQVMSQGGSTATMLMAAPHYARVVREGKPMGFDSPTDPVAVHIVPHLIHLPPSVPGGVNKPWWWDTVQHSHAAWLDTYKKGA